jgi:RimJ/RimL family protein N-acetyltransferase
MIETERLTLRGWTLDDVEPHRKMSGDVGYTCFSAPGFFAFKDETELREKVAKRAKQFSDTGWGKYLVFEKGTHSFVGTCGVEPFAYGEGTIHELGYRLMLEHWGKGFATEAARGVMKHYFDVLKQPMLHAFALPQNAPSLKIIGKLGFDRCGEVKFYGLTNYLYVRGHSASQL